MRRASLPVLTLLAGVTDSFGTLTKARLPWAANDLHQKQTASTVVNNVKIRSRHLSVPTLDQLRKEVWIATVTPPLGCSSLAALDHGDSVGESVFPPNLPCMSRKKKEITLCRGQPQEWLFNIPALQVLSDHNHQQVMCCKGRPLVLAGADCPCVHPRLL